MASHPCAVSAAPHKHKESGRKDVSSFNICRNEAQKTCPQCFKLQYLAVWGEAEITPNVMCLNERFPDM